MHVQKLAISVRASNFLAMAAHNRILVVAATPKELGPPDGWRTLVCGVGPVEAAITTAAALERERPALLLHVGIAGARRDSGLLPPTLVIGDESRYVDLGVSAEWAPGRLTVDGEMLAVVRDALPDAAVRAIGTSARVGGGFGCAVEAMEGFAVLRAAQRYDVPALEVRAISNAIEEADRARWQFAQAFEAIIRATRRIVPALAAWRA